MSFAIPVTLTRFSFAPWFFGGLLIGIVLSIPLIGRDLAIMVAWENAALENERLLWWAGAASQSLFGIGGLGAQDISHFFVALVIAAYVLSFWGRLGAKGAVLRIQSGYFLACLVFFFVVNRGMKVFFGRVRPSDVLRNDTDYTPMWHIGNYELADALSKGSFASGHTTMAMVLLPLAFLALKTGRRAVVLFALALTWGLLVGWGRVINGSHYPSDILWAVIICVWICAYVQAYLLSPHQSPGKVSGPIFWDLRLILWSALALLLFFTAITGIKEIIFRFAWWWPAISALSGLGVWFCLQRVSVLQQKVSFLPGRPS